MMMQNGQRTFNALNKKTEAWALSVQKLEHNQCLGRSICSTPTFVGVLQSICTILTQFLFAAEHDHSIY